MTNIKDLISDLKSISENETVGDMRQAVLDLVNELEEIANHEKKEQPIKKMPNKCCANCCLITIDNICSDTLKPIENEKGSCDKYEDCRIGMIDELPEALDMKNKFIAKHTDLILIGSLFSLWILVLILIFLY